MAVSPINAPAIDNAEPNAQPIYITYLEAEYDVIDEIAGLEENFLDTEKQHNMYYIGSAIYYPQLNSIQLDTAVSLRTLFSYEIDDIALYLAEYSVSNIRWRVPCIHILKLDIKPDGEYRAIIKTFWLKIVQRAWKKRFAERQSVIRSRGHIAAQRHFELTGTYPRDLRIIRGLRGLLLSDNIDKK
uniref:Uncharacterized protein n=1 Tax=viral metagenome TaxID=1070528 RepID=A0A6C0HJ78_9ZZZZ